MTGGEYWRGRAGLGVKGVVATAEGLSPHAPDAIGPVRLRRIPAGEAFAGLVRHFWIPRWTLPTGAVVEQAVLEYPTANIVVDADAAAIYGAHTGMSRRRLEGTGWAIGALLEVGIARSLTGDAECLIDASIPLSTLGIPGTAPMVDEIRRHAELGDDAAAADALGTWLVRAGPRPEPDAALVAAAVEVAESDRTIVRVEQLAERVGSSVRSLQRRCREQLGFSPKQLIHHYRMQEAAYALSGPDRPAIAELAIALGFSDQAHFTRAFRDVVGVTPAEFSAGPASGAGTGDDV